MSIRCDLCDGRPRMSGRVLLCEKCRAPVQRYLEGLDEMQVLQAVTDDPYRYRAEDHLSDKLDALWRQMDEEQRTFVREAMRERHLARVAKARAQADAQDASERRPLSHYVDTGGPIDTSRPMRGKKAPQK